MLVNNNLKKGFTLIEVVVASGLLVLASGAALTVSQMAVRSQDLSMERTQAYHLSQEGLEIVREMRDTAQLDPTRPGQSDAWKSDFLNALQGKQKVSPIWNNEPSVQRWQLVNTNASNPVIVDGEEKITVGSMTFYRSLSFTLPTDQIDANMPLVDSKYDFSKSIDTQPNAKVQNGFQINAVQVSVKVRWIDRSREYSVSGSTLLSNWKLAS